jgi:hypothetical protein
MGHRRSAPANSVPVSPQEASDRLGFSHQHLVSLIEAGELAADELPGARGWQISLGSVLDFEERRAIARQQADEHARGLDRLGAPLE